MCPERDEIPEIVKKLEARVDIAELDKVAEDYRIESWEKIPGNAKKLQRIKELLYEHQVPLAGNMTGRIQHCTVITGYDGDKLIYQDHDLAGRERTVEHSKFNSAYFLKKGGCEMVKEFKSFKTVEEFKSYMSALKVTRNIKRVQLHHTWSPSYKNFTGNNHQTLQKNMQNYHVGSCGWADIGQHFTIFPDGVIMTGRSMNSSPAGIANANTGGICVECIGNFDKGGDVMTEAQKNAIVGAVKVLLDRFGLSASGGVTYHAWWSGGGTNLGTYVAGKSQKTCPGTNFFGGNTKEAYEKNLRPLVENYGREVVKVEEKELKPVESINDIVWELSNAGIISNGELWVKKCEEDVNVYWLCRKMANKLRGTL